VPLELRPLSRTPAVNDAEIKKLTGNLSHGAFESESSDHEQAIKSLRGLKTAAHGRSLI
jgi:hypothetical protein